MCSSPRQYSTRHLDTMSNIYFSESSMRLALSISPIIVKFTINAGNIGRAGPDPKPWESWKVIAHCHWQVANQWLGFAIVLRRLAKACSVSFAAFDLGSALCATVSCLSFYRDTTWQIMLHLFAAAPVTTTGPAWQATAVFIEMYTVYGFRWLVHVGRINPDRLP
jgi:hypothetical protein